MVLLTHITKDLFQSYTNDFWNCLRHNSLNNNIKKIIVFSDIKIQNTLNIDKVSFVVRQNLDKEDLINYSSGTALIKSDPFVKFHGDLKKISLSEIQEFVLIGDGFEIFSNSTKHLLTKQSEKKFRSADIFTQRKKVNLQNSISKNVLNGKNPKLDVIIGSVNYNDYLILTLERNIKIFENITVFTTPDDTTCHRICENFGVKYVKTNVMYESGAKFNKGRLMEFAINMLHNPEFILLLDGDMIINRKIDTQYLEKNVLYTTDRYIIPDFSLWQNYLIDPEKTISQIPTNVDERGIGFFQLFHIDSDCLNKDAIYPTDSIDASWTDLKFRDKFSKKINLDLQSIHLGQPYLNWSGRNSESFIDNNIFREILNESMDTDEVAHLRPKEQLNFLSRNDIVKFRLEYENKFKSKSNKDELTILITNWRRPELLDNCLNSVVGQNCKNIVVCSFDLSEEVLEIIRKYLKIRPDLIVDVYSNDNGCNQLWLRAAYQSTTNFVLILHDDDLLSESFESSYNEIVKKYIKNGYKYFLWNGQVEKDGVIINRFKYLNSSTSALKTDSLLYENYKKINQWPLSPVVQIFSRDLLIKTLKECESNFTSKDFYTKPKMMLGNEILTTLRHLETLEEFVYIDDYLTKFVNWHGSETVLNENSENNKLMIGYNKTKEYFSKHDNSFYKPDPYIIHVSSIYKTEDENSMRRMFFAQKTWQNLYESEKVIPSFYYKKSSSKSLPTIKELFDFGFKKCQSDNDIILYTNADICLTNNLYNQIVNTCAEYNCTFSFRKDFKEKIEHEKNIDEIKSAEWYVGADLFAVTKSWWEKWRDFLPDNQVIGRPTWDWVFRISMGYSIQGDLVFNQSLEQQGSVCETPNISYHEKHDSFWERSENLFLKSNLENIKIAYNWMKQKSTTENFTGKEYFESTYGEKLN